MFIDTLERSKAQELIDLGPNHYSESEYFDCLKQLGRIGSILGGDRATLKAFDQLKTTPTSILDVGCGGGYFTRKLAERYPQAKVVGIDTSEQAILFANQFNRIRNESGHESKIPNLFFEHRTHPELNEPQYDIVTSTLVCHHLPDDILVDFLKRSYSIANQAVIFNDLHRHWLAYASFGMIAPILFNNRLITNDGKLSVLRSFKKSDWIFQLEKANIPLEQCHIEWKWAFRWLLTIQK